MRYDSSRQGRVVTYGIHDIDENAAGSASASTTSAQLRSNAMCWWQLMGAGYDEYITSRDGVQQWSACACEVNSKC